MPTRRWAITCTYVEQYPVPQAVTRPQWVNSSPPSVTYMCWWTETSLIQVMACRLYGTEPLPKPMLAYFQLDSWEQISLKFESEFNHLHSRKLISKCHLPKCRPFCPWVKYENPWSLNSVWNRHLPMYGYNILSGIWLSEIPHKNILALLWKIVFYIRDHFVYGTSQWETTLQCNVVSHWLGAFTKWFLLHKLQFKWLLDVRKY